MAEIQQSLELSDKELRAIRDFLKTLSLQPAGQIEQDEVYIRPDVEIYLAEGGNLAFRWLEEIPDVYFREDLYAEYAARRIRRPCLIFARRDGPLPTLRRHWPTVICPSSRS